ncbi:LysR family transcriptional regulator [Hoeflea sp. CAU 1731]
MDWDLIRSFLAVAENGTLAQAAERLGVSQPTIGRHIDALEAELGLTLFSRGRHGMTPTEAGLSLIDDARDMRRGADHLALRAAGKVENVGGTVRITASEVVATFILPAIIAGFAQEEPDIEIELAPSNTVENLLSRDADIAIRMVRSDQNDVIARKVNDMGIGVYMHRELAHQDGVPKSPDALLAHRVIGMDRSDLIIDSMTRLGFKARRNDFTIRTDHQIAYVELVKSGAGIGFIAQFIAKNCPDLIRILPEIQIPSLPLWLASHSELRTSRRIRRTMDYLYEALRALPLDE